MKEEITVDGVKYRRVEEPAKPCKIEEITVDGVKYRRVEEPAKPCKIVKLRKDDILLAGIAYSYKKMGYHFEYDKWHPGYDIVNKDGELIAYVVERGGFPANCEEVKE